MKRRRSRRAKRITLEQYARKNKQSMIAASVFLTPLILLLKSVAR
jgi:hypothetical protein